MEVVSSTSIGELKFVEKYDILHNGFLYLYGIFVEKQCILNRSGVNAVTKMNKNYLHIGFVISLLIVTATICEHANTDSILRTTNGILLGLIRSSIYIGMFAAWRFSLRQRIVPKNTRRYLSAVAFLLILWMVIRTVKYYFVADPNINRILWYCYYIPMLFVPLLSIFVSESIGKPEDSRMSKWLIPATILTSIFTLFVLTNDLHQLVFAFPENASVFTDGDYTYQTIYFLVIGWEIVCALTAIGIMLYKCRLPRTRKILWLPFAPTGIAVLYGVLYASGSGFVINYIPDITVFQCLTFAAIFESCIACGLIQSNTHYKELFTASDLPVYITDKKYHLQMASGGSAELPERSELNTGGSIMLKDYIRLSKSEICGGYAFWTDDVSEIAKAISELQDINKTLKERHTLIREENRTNKQKAHLFEANRLYNRMQFETAPQLKKMQDLVSALQKGDKPEKELLAELTMIGAYFKRRNNLLFISETQDTIRMAELGYCFQESVSALELQGVTGSYFVEDQGNISLSECIQLYDAFQSVLQKTFSCITSIAVILRIVESCFEMCISLHLTTGMKVQFDPYFRVEQEEENDYLLTCFVAREDGEGK